MATLVTTREDVEKSPAPPSRKIGAKEAELVSRIGRLKKVLSDAGIRPNNNESDPPQTKESPPISQTAQMVATLAERLTELAVLHLHHHEFEAAHSTLLEAHQWADRVRELGLQAAINGPLLSEPIPKYGPVVSPILKLLSFLCQKRNELDAALRYLTEAMDLGWDTPQANLDRASILFRLSRYAECTDFALRTIEIAERRMNSRRRQPAGRGRGGGGAHNNGPSITSPKLKSAPSENISLPGVMEASPSLPLIIVLAHHLLAASLRHSDTPQLAQKSKNVYDDTLRLSAHLLGQNHPATTDISAELAHFFTPRPPPAFPPIAPPAFNQSLNPRGGAPHHRPQPKPPVMLPPLPQPMDGRNLTGLTTTTTMGLLDHDGGPSMEPNALETAPTKPLELFGLPPIGVGPFAHFSPGSPQQPKLVPHPPPQPRLPREAHPSTVVAQQRDLSKLTDAETPVSPAVAAGKPSPSATTAISPSSNLQKTQLRIHDLLQLETQERGQILADCFAVYLDAAAPYVMPLEAHKRRKIQDTEAQVRNTIAQARSLHCHRAPPRKIVASHSPKQAKTSGDERDAEEEEDSVAASARNALRQTLLNQTVLNEEQCRIPILRFEDSSFRHLLGLFNGMLMNQLAQHNERLDLLERALNTLDNLSQQETRTRSGLVKIFEATAPKPKPAATEPAELTSTLELSAAAGPLNVAERRSPTTNNRTAVSSSSPLQKPTSPVMQAEERREPTHVVVSPVLSPTKPSLPLAGSPKARQPVSPMPLSPKPLVMATFPAPSAPSSAVELEKLRMEQREWMDRLTLTDAETQDRREIEMNCSHALNRSSEGHELVPAAAVYTHRASGVAAAAYTFPVLAPGQLRSNSLFSPSASTSVRRLSISNSGIISSSTQVPLSANVTVAGATGGVGGGPAPPLAIAPAPSHHRQNSTQQANQIVLPRGSIIAGDLPLTDPTVAAATASRSPSVVAQTQVRSLLQALPERAQTQLLGLIQGIAPSAVYQGKTFIPEVLTRTQFEQVYALVLRFTSAHHGSEVISC